MFKKIIYLVGLLSIITAVVADSGITDMYATNPDMNNIVESGSQDIKLGFKTGWYGHADDVTYIKLISVGNNIGLSVLFNTRGLVCPINQYLLFKQSQSNPSTYNYTVAKVL